jgi:hypothetical protein
MAVPERWTLTPDARARTKGYPLVTDGPMLDGEIAVVPEAEVERLREALTRHRDARTTTASDAFDQIGDVVQEALDA